MRTSRCAQTASSSTWSRSKQRSSQKLNAENQRLRDEMTKLKGITEPGKEYFHSDGFALAGDLAIAKAITTAH
eukprot:6039814-Pleurochrysis_carterae.AAC.1